MGGSGVSAALCAWGVCGDGDPRVGKALAHHIAELLGLRWDWAGDSLGTRFSGYQIFRVPYFLDVKFSGYRFSGYQIFWMSGFLGIKFSVYQIFQVPHFLGARFSGLYV